MAYSYTTRNGQRVQVNVAAAFDALAAAFKARFGLDLLVTSGTRTRAEQQHLYNLYKAGKGNLAAAPGYSNHEETGTTGPRALDVRDSGSDAGVTRRGTMRANWLRANAPKYGFNPAGYNFKQVEPWHIEYTGVLSNTTGGGSTSTGKYDSNVQKTQRQLNFLGFNCGEEDGLTGPKYVAAVKAFQKAYGLAVDGIAGVNTKGKLEEQVKWVQNRLIAWGYNIGSHGADGDPGRNTKNATKAFQAANGLTADEIAGVNTRSKLAQNKPAPTPTIPVGRNATSRPTKQIQEYLIAQGYNLGVWGADNEWGAATGKAVYEWQGKVGLKQDAIWGVESDKKAFGVTTTPTPSQPPVQAPVKEYTPVLPFASKGIESPKGKDKRDNGSKITALAVHHTGSLADQEGYFSGTTGSVPTWYVKGKTIIEFVRPGLRPITTAKANNYTVSIETQNTTGAPEWKVAEESIESIAQIAAWLYSYNGKTLDGILVEFELDRNHIKGHKEFPNNATICPGPYLENKLDYIVKRAKEIYTEKYTTTPPPGQPEKPSEPPVQPETPTTPQGYIQVKRSVLEAAHKELVEAKTKIEALEIVLNNLLGGKK